MTLQDKLEEAVRVKAKQTTICPLLSTGQWEFRFGKPSGKELPPLLASCIGYPCALWDEGRGGCSLRRGPAQQHHRKKGKSNAPMRNGSPADKHNT